MESVNVTVTDSPEVVAVNVAVGFGTVVNSDATYSATVNSGDTLVVPDTIVKNTNGTTILTQPSATSTGVIADSVVTNSDNTFSLNVPAETNPVLADITHIDSDGTPVVYPSAKAFTCTPVAAPTYASAKLMKTGQTTSYRTGDDGDIEAGREVDFLTLKANNPFGNTSRFTDELGGATYTNNIVIDWSTFDGVSVLGYKRTYQASALWAGAIDSCLVINIGIYVSGWRMANIKEWYNIVVMENIATAPLPSMFIQPSMYIWTSNTCANNTPSAYMMAFEYQIAHRLFSKTGASLPSMAVRTFTVSGTTLT